ncbi:MAG: hypothetical protein DLD55_03540 [candidate division SR1 bacterium]|nr:MAG: hypothetical protein DLD55_03540 [candidate division SR1 bacterium]
MTTRTTLDRIKNMKVNIGGNKLIANPGLYFTQAENAKDISKPKTSTPNPSIQNLPLPPLSCEDWTDRYRLEIQEIFRGNEQYTPFLELKWTDSPEKYEQLRLTGTLLASPITLEKSELWEKNTSFLISKDEFWHNRGIDSQFSSDFKLQEGSGYLILEGLNRQGRQVLDSILLTGFQAGQSSYFGGEKAECFPFLNQTGTFSPGFDKKFLDYFQIDSTPKIEYITIGGGGCNCSCPSKEDLCPAKPKKTEIQTPQEEENFDSSKYQIKIEAIDYDPPGADDQEKITLILTEGEHVNLDGFHLLINGKKKSLQGSLQQGISQTLVGKFGFPNTSKERVLVQLKYQDKVLDSYYYQALGKQKTEQKLKPKEGIKVFSVLDGDTIRYKDESGKLQSVRLLGVDAPESNTARYKKTECYGKEAKEYLRERLKGAYIQLSFDEESPHYDRYGRQLAYVWLENQLINEELIRKGYAREYRYKTNYKEQENFKKAEQDAQSEQIGMRNPNNCPKLIEKDEASKKDSEDLVIKITDIEYQGSGGQERLTLSIFDKSETRKTIDFSHHFGLFIFEKTGEQLTFDFEELEQQGKFKELDFLGIQDLKSPLILQGKFGFPNTKSSCVALVQKEHLFDLACYDVEKKKEKAEINEHLTGLQISIHSLTPNPRGKDQGKERIELSFKSEDETLQTLDLAQGFYLLINGKTKKKLQGFLEKEKKTVLEGSFAFPNTESCITIGKGNQLFDTFCYGKPKEGRSYVENNEALHSLASEELQILKSLKLVKINNQYCISFNKQTFTCRNIPKKQAEASQTRKFKAQARESAFFGLEKLLKKEYTALYEETQIGSYFQLAKAMKKDLKNLSSTGVKLENPGKKLVKSFENGGEKGSINPLLKSFLHPKLLENYKKKSKERINALAEGKITLTSQSPNE